MKYPFVVEERELLEENIRGDRNIMYDFQEEFSREKVQQLLEKCLKSLSL